MTDRITPEDIAKSDKYDSLGPAYFACQRMAEALMNGVEPDDLKKAAAKAADDVRHALYEYIEEHIKTDLECNLAGYMRGMVERTVSALLTGEEWAMRQYVLTQFYDGEKVRAAVAKHGGESLLMARIDDLEKEIARLRSDLEWHRR